MQDMSINQGDSLYLSIIKYDDEGNEVAFDKNPAYLDMNQ